MLFLYSIRLSTKLLIYLFRFELGKVQLRYFYFTKFTKKAFLSFIMHMHIPACAWFLCLNVEYIFQYIFLYFC
jgi:hypothetical protein